MIKKQILLIIIFQLFFLSVLRNSGLSETGNPEEKKLLNKEINSYVNQYDFANAKSVIEKALKIYPEDWKINKTYIDIHVSFNRVFLILPYYIKMIESNPEKEVYYSAAALCSLFEGNNQIAENYLEKSQKINKISISTLNAKAIIKARVSGYEEGQKVYEELLENYPDYGDGYIEYIDWLTRRNGFDKKYVMKYFEKAKTIKDINPLLLSYEVNIKSDELLYDQKESVEIYKDILQKDSSLAVIRYYLAKSYSDLGDKENEYKTLMELTQAAPLWSKSWFSLGSYYSKYKEFDKAISIFEKMILLPIREEEKILSQYLVIENLYYAEKYDEALSAAGTFMQKYQGSNLMRSAQKLLSVILSRDKNNRIKIIDNVPYLVQKGNYCGPATLSILLKYWGVEKSQDEIAASIYTGVVGTAPQVIDSYCRSLGFRVYTFRGNKEIWKSIIDQNIPVLWLKQLKQGAHYIVVSGYDDNVKEFFLNNPHYSFRTTVSYDDIKDEWIFPDVTRSLIIIPENKANLYDLTKIKKDSYIEVINYFFYYSTGSNLFSGFFPEILGNIFFAGIFILFTGLMIYKRTFPCSFRIFILYMIINLLCLIIINFIIYKYHYSKAVSVITAYHFFLFSFSLILFLYSAMFFYAQDYFTPYEVTGIAFTIFLVYQSSVFFEKEGVDILLSLGILVIGILFSLRLRFRIILGRKKERKGMYTERLDFYKKYGSESSGDKSLFHAYLKEILIYKKLGIFEKVIQLSEKLLKEKNLTRYHRNHLNRELLESKLIQVQIKNNIKENDLSEIEEILKYSRKTRPNILERVYLDILESIILFLKKDYEKSLLLSSDAHDKMKKPGFIMKIHKFLQISRGFTNEFNDFYLLNSVNIVRSADILGKKEYVEMIKAEYNEHFDYKFLMRTELYKMISSGE